MVQRPLLKNGVVVNIIEIEDDTCICTKEEHKARTLEENSAYANRLAGWKGHMAKLKNQFDAAKGKLITARMTLAALEARRSDATDPKVATTFTTQINQAKDEVAAAQSALDQIQRAPLPQKPLMFRAKRWFHHEDGIQVGPAGGHIGDTWDGKKYIAPAGKTANGPDEMVA
jgi:hypothetical protein